MSKYFNPYTDFGFKKLFGEEANKDLLIDFLNQLMPAHHQIADLKFNNVEQLPNTTIERKAIFDISCTSITGERFIIEMQKAKTHFFKDRALFYVTYPIREQAEKGKWSFELSPIYFIAILDFQYTETEEKLKFRRDVMLKDQDGEIFFDKLNFKFLQMPLFNKQAHELETHFDKWIYFLKNLDSFDQIPEILNEPVFQKAFKTAELSNLSQEQYNFYEQNLLDYRTNQAAWDTAWNDGEKAGIEKGEKLGIEKGEKLGIEKGEKIGQVNLLTTLLQHRFGELPDWATTKINYAPSEQLQQWSLKVLSSETLEQVFEA
ncbi:Rpn family recombination-promoting nuclease/putative transposase [Candidatus Albibeggiatoa sp. nov. BB20]|uniref:Rpn family recombination-promoting nuclease/putative transposase n=1 Tax=Candidatus Albibeggiatoa sp. nov. BB20 TaxID=3162723 RepID=UPI0033658376